MHADWKAKPKRISKKTIHQIAQNDEMAFRYFFDNYHQKLMHIAIYFLKSKEWAEEAVADVFYQIWRKKEELENIEDIDSYLFISIKNQCLHYLRRSVPIDESSTNLYEIEWLPDSCNPESELLEQEYLHLIQQAIDSLPLKCKEVFRLVFTDKLKYKDIALLLDISEKTVAAQIAKAYTRIAEYINKKYREVGK